MLCYLMISSLGMLVTSTVMARSCPPNSMNGNGTDIPSDTYYPDPKETPQPDPPEEDPMHPVSWDPMLEELKKQHETLKYIKEALEIQNEAVKSIVKSLGVIEEKLCRLADRHALENEPDDGSDNGPDNGSEDESKTEELLRMQLEALKWIKQALTTQNGFAESVIEYLDAIEEKICRPADEFAPPAPDDGSDSVSDDEQTF